MNRSTISNRLKSVRAAEKALAVKIRSELRAAGKEFPVVYLPNSDPPALAEIVFVTMEPSLGRWATNEEVAERWVDEGFRNFLLSWEDFLFHYAAVHYLKRHYLITDISKMGMLVKNAEDLWKSLYPRWFPLLKEEIKAAGAPGCSIIPVGNRVDSFLKKNSSGLKLGQKIPHYSWEARGAWKNIPESQAHKENFGTFCKTISRDVVLNFAATHLEENRIPKPIQERVLEKLNPKKKANPKDLGLSHKKLLYTYKVLFEGMRSGV